MGLHGCPIIVPFCASTFLLDNAALTIVDGWHRILLQPVIASAGDQGTDSPRRIISRT
jgi:hypothetical protein